MKHLILTLDYELYGDGSGDVFEQMIQPTERILSICDLYGIKLTLFFEVLEYIRLKQEWGRGNNMGYVDNPVGAIEQQLQKMAENGHDIQLHVHPQWVNARFEDGSWQVDFDNWRLGDFDVPQDYSIEDMLREGKETIEALVRPVCPDYECTILRAGGYNVMPSGPVYRAMVNTGLRVDSSVYPGGFEDGDLSCFDFRAASLQQDHWPTLAEDFCSSAEGSQVLEIPIMALPQRRLRKITPSRIRSALQNRGAASRSLAAKTGKRSLWQKVTYLLEKEAFTWDFCLFDFRMHKRFFRYIDQHLSARDAFVLIGHPKGYTTDKHFDRMLRHALAGGYSFITLQALASQAMADGVRPVTTILKNTGRDRAAAILTPSTTN